MFGLILVIAVANFALGYGVAVYLGWAKRPQFRKVEPVTANDSASHGH